MVPFLLVYGPEGDDRHQNILSFVELKRSRRNKKVYMNVYDMDYQAYRYDCDAEDIVGYRAWAIPAIFHRETDWGNLEEFHDELAEGWRKNCDKMQGITLSPEIITNLGEGRIRIQQEYFLFDPKTITIESANLFLSAIGGSIRLY